MSEGTDTQDGTYRSQCVDRIHGGGVAGSEISIHEDIIREHNGRRTLKNPDLMGAF